MSFGLEMHLVTMHKLIKDFQPSTVIVDPVSNLISIGFAAEVRMLLMRLVDILKQSRITSLFTSLTELSSEDRTEVGVSSLMDTWLLVKNLELEGERNRGMYIIKSRGMAHSNQIREFLLTSSGVELIDVYVGPGGVLTGAARSTQEAKDKAEALLILREKERKLHEIERRRQVREARIAALRAETEAEEEEAGRILDEARLREEVLAEDREELARLRKADISSIITAQEGAHK